MNKLIGYRMGTAQKTGRAYCMAYVLSEPSDRDKEFGAVGQVAEKVYMPADQVDFLKPEFIGKELKFDYVLSGGKPYLSHVTVK